MPDFDYKTQGSQAFGEHGTDLKTVSGNLFEETKVPEYSDAILFFNTKGLVTHIAFYLGKGMMTHCDFRGVEVLPVDKCVYKNWRAYRWLPQNC